MTSPGSLGRDGKGKAPPWRLTELEAFGGRPERAAYLTADNQMTRRPNLALNAEIVSSGRTANSAARKARDPEIIDLR
jgi:hypothetical protein